MFDDLLDDVQVIFDTLDRWLTEAFDWMKNFFSKVFDIISEWGPIIADWFDAVLTDLRDCGFDVDGVIANPYYQKGREIIDVLSSADGSKVNVKENGNVAFTMHGNGIDKIADFNANRIENPAAFNKVMEERDGVIIMDLKN